MDVPCMYKRELDDGSFEWLYNCNACKLHSEQCRVIARTLDPRESEVLWKISNATWKKNCSTMNKKHHEGNGKPKGLFAGTLTMSPTDPENENTMINAMRKIFNQETCPVKKYAWYLEYQQNGLPHVHFIYETVSSGRIHQKVFKRYWKMWDENKKQGQGFRGGYHKVVDSTTAYLEYIAKDEGRHESKWE